MVMKMVVTAKPGNHPEYMAAFPMIIMEATEENAYDLWCVLWDDILQEPQPTLTAPEA